MGQGSQRTIGPREVRHCNCGHFTEAQRKEWVPQDRQAGITSPLRWALLSLLKSQKPLFAPPDTGLVHTLTMHSAHLSLCSHSRIHMQGRAFACTVHVDTMSCL